MSNKKRIIVPLQVARTDAREAYLARYHSPPVSDKELRRIIFREYGEICACCGLNDIDQLTLDHIKPIRGGPRKTYEQLYREGFPRENLQVLCSTCNTSKAAGQRCSHAIIAQHMAFYASLILRVIVRENSRA